MLRRWGLGPVFFYETVMNARRWQVYALRALFVAVLLIGFVVVWLTNLAESGQFSRTGVTLQQMSEIGEELFYAIAGIQLSVVLLAAPAATAGSICMDRARGTLLHMLVTDLSDVEIVLGKLFARFAPMIGVIACGVPVAALGGLLGGIEFGALAGAFAVSLALALLGCALALAVSVWVAKPNDVLMAVYAAEILGLLALPFWLELRGSTGVAAPVWFQKLNPFVLVFAPYTNPGFVHTSDYAVFVGASVILSTVLLAVSVGLMRRVVIAQSGRQEKQVRRRRSVWQRLLPSWTGPSLDGNPVLWREWHRGRPSRLAHRLWIFMMVTTWAFAAWGTYDIIRNGLSAGANALTSTLLFQIFFGLLMLSATAPTALAEERVRGSLDVVLTTPLATQLIVAGKWWGTYRRVFLLTLLPLFAATFMAACAPDTPFVQRAVRFPHPLLPVSGMDRVCAAVLSVADFLASSAVIVSLGLALATWTRRLGRAVAISVITYIVMAIGIIIAAELGYAAIAALARQWFGIADWSATHRWVGTCLMGLSPLAGPIVPMEVITEFTWENRTPRWIASGGVVALKGSVAWLLYWLTVKTFDRCLERVPEIVARPSGLRPVRLTEFAGASGPTADAFAANRP